MPTVTVAHTCLSPYSSANTRTANQHNVYTILHFCLTDDRLFPKLLYSKLGWSAEVNTYTIGWLCVDNPKV